MVESEFHYIIVGGGSAGAVLANRLSADPSVRVCLLEAGSHDRSPLIKIPLGLMLLAKHQRYNWLYQSTPQTSLAGRKISIPRGKVLGGSSAINGMVYIRGHRADYDAWAKAGCAGWDYDSVLPYFIKSENNNNTTVDNQYHGTGGELSVSNLREPNDIDHDFIEAASHLQVPHCADFNVPEPEGVGIYQVTQKDGQRHSTAAAFLHNIKNRPNLLIETDAEVSKILFEKNRAVGVVVTRPNLETQKFKATNELILCAGAIGSPDLLLRSGVGPGQNFTNSDTPLVHDLSGVGQNLHDHVDVMVICSSRSATPYGLSLRAMPRLIKDAYKWGVSKRGILSSNMVEAGGFIRSGPEQQRPDIQLHIIPGRKSHRGRLFEYGHGVSIHACVLNPKSRGSVMRKQANGPPDIDLGLLNDDDDLARLNKGIRVARRILEQKPFEKHGLNEIIPGDHNQDDAALNEYIKKEAKTVYHPVGTCAMGSDANAVVDSRLRVHGITNLRIVDASIMPSIVSGNTNAPTIMIAEKAADMIIADRRAN